MWVKALRSNSNVSGLPQCTVLYYNTDGVRMLWQFAVDGKYYISAEPYPNILIDGSLASRLPITSHMSYVWAAGSFNLYQYDTTVFKICSVLCGNFILEPAIYPVWTKTGSASIFGSYTRNPAGAPSVVSYSTVGIPSNAALIGTYSDGTVVGWETLEDTSGVLAAAYPGFSYFQDTLPYRNGLRYFHANAPATLRLWWSTALSRYIVVNDPGMVFDDPPPVGIGYWQSISLRLDPYVFVPNGSGMTFGNLAIVHDGYASAEQLDTSQQWHYAYGGGLVSSELTAVTRTALNYR